MSVFRKYDAGDGKRAPRAKGRDCQVRALATALGIDYRDAWSLLYQIQGERHACDFTLVDDLRIQDSRFHVLRQLDFPAEKGKRRMTGADFCRKHPKGRFILRMAHHVVCVKDGQLYDTHDCSRSCVYTAWEIEP